MSSYIPFKKTTNTTSGGYVPFKNFRSQTPTQPLWQKILKGNIDVLGKVGDVLMRPLYAVANMEKYKVEQDKKAGVDTKLKSIMGFQEQRQNIAKNKTYSTKDVLQAGLRGLKGQEKTTFKDVLNAQGLGDMGTLRVPYTKDPVDTLIRAVVGKKPIDTIKTKDIVTGKGATGLAMDVALDPLTWLTAGTGKGIQIATKQGEKTLTKEGGVEFLKLAESMNKDVNKIPERVLVEKAFEKKIAKTPSLVDEGGVKIGGYQIPLTNKVTTPVEKLIKMGTSKVGKAAGIVSEPVFRRQQQAFRDLQKAIAHEVELKYNNLFKGLNGKSKKLVTQSLEDPSVLKSLTPKLRAVHDAAKAEFADILAKEQAAGMGIEALKDYVTHLYKGNDQKKVLQYIKNLGTEPRFAKERTLKSTLTEIEKNLGLKPEYDIQKILTTRRLASERAIQKSNFLKEVAQTMGRKSKVKIRDTEGILPGFEKFAPKTKEIVNPAISRSKRVWTEVPGAKELKGISLPDNVASYVSRMFEITPETNKAIRAFDKLTNFFKKSVTIAFPSFHTRNKMSNIWSNILDVGLYQTLNPKTNLIANKIMSSQFGDEIVKLGGKEYTIDALRTIMKRNGVIGSRGFFDVLGVIHQMDVGTRFGQYIENSDRAVNFIANLDMIGDPITAAEKTKKFLFDYDNLSAFEQSTLKRVFPFWTWTSKNIPLQAENLFRQPGKYAALFKAQNFAQNEYGVPETEKEKQNVPDYLKNVFKIKTGNNANGDPIYATGLGNPLENFTQFLASPTRTGTEMLSPYIKAPIEGGTGKDLYYDKNVSEITNPDKFTEWISKKSPYLGKLIGYSETTTPNWKGENVTTKTANPWALWITRQPPFSRLYSSISKSMGGESKLQSFTGLRAKPYKIDEAIYYNTKDQYLSHMSQSEQDVYNSVYGNKLTPDNKNWKTIEKSSTLLTYPTVLQAQNEMQREVAYKTGNPIDPFYLLPDDQQKVVLTYQALPKGETGKSNLLKENQWLLDYWDTSSKFWKEAGAPQTVEANPKGVALSEQYYALPSGTGERTKFIKAHPELLTYWADKKSATNALRASMGLPAVPDTSFTNKSYSSSSSNKYKNQKTSNLIKMASFKAKKTTIKKMPKPKKIKPFTLKTLRARLV